MSGAEWTTERLDALPEGTVIEWSGDDWSAYLIRRSTRGWNWEGLEGLFNSQSFVGDSIRVVSVPIDALLADEAVHAWDMHPADAYETIRAAVAHVIGGSHE